MARALSLDTSTSGRRAESGRPRSLSILTAGGLLVALGGPAAAQTGAPVPNPTTNHGVAEGVAPARNGQFEDLDPATSVARHNGELLHHWTDVALEGAARDFTFTRAYRSQVSYDDILGPGWTHSYDQRVWSDGQAGILHMDGMRFALDTYPSGGSGRLDCTTPGVYRKARSIGGGVWEIRDAHGAILRFRALNGSKTAGKLDRIIDTFGNELVAQYDGKGRLSSIETDLYDPGTAPTRRVDFLYKAGRLDRLVDVHNARTWTYAYDKSGRLESVSTPAVSTLVGDVTVQTARIIQYDYVTDAASNEHVHNLYSITYPGHAQPRIEIVYDDEDHVSTAFVRAADLPGGAPWFKFGYAALTSGPEVLETIVTDRRGFATSYRFDVLGRALTVIDPSANAHTYEYNADGEITRHVQPEGNDRSTTYASASALDRFQHGNAVDYIHRPAPGKPGSQNSYRVQARYEPIYNQKLDTVDEGGEIVFDYQEDPQTIAGLISAWGIQTPTIAALGDVNGDGRVDQGGGAVIQKSTPPITTGLPSGTGGPVVRTETWTFDDRGRVLSHADGEGALTAFVYTDGFLSQVIEDLDPDPGTCPNAPGTYPNSGTSRWTKPCSVAHVQAQTDVVRDGRGNVLAVTDPRGVVSTYTYTALDELESMTLGAAYDAARLSPELAALGGAGYGHLVQPGVQELYDYDASGDLARIRRDNRGSGDSANDWVIVRVEYDLGGRMTRVEEDLTATDKAVTTLTYDDSGNPLLVTDAEGGVAARVHDAHDRLHELRKGAAPDGSVLPTTSVATFTYDLNGLRTEIQGPEDLDGDGLLEKTLFDFDGRNRLHRIVSPVGTESLFGYGSRGWGSGSRVLGRVEGPSPGQNSTTGNVVLNASESEQNEIGEDVLMRELRFTPGQVPGSHGAETSLAYDRAGRIVERTDTLGHVTTVTYDGLGRTLTLEDGLGNVTRNRYDAGGYLVERISEEPDPFGGPVVSRSTFETRDGLGRLLRTVTGGEVTYYAHDAQGNVVVEADGRSAVSQPDPLGIYTDGLLPRPGNTTRTTRARTAAGLRLQVLSDMWQDGTANGGYEIWADGLDPAAAPSGVSLTEVSTIQLDRVSRVEQVQSAGALAMTFQYDDQGRMTVKTFPDGSSTLTTYWRNGLVHTHTLRDSAGNALRAVETSYDAAGRRASVSVTQAPAGYAGTTLQTFEWNGLDLITRATDDKASGEYLSSVVERTYDSLGRVLTESQNGLVVTRAHDDLYETGFTFPGGRAIEWRVDARGRIDEIIDPASGTTIADYSYFGAGSRVAEILFGNGTSKSYRDAPPGSGLANGYSGSGRPLQLEHRGPGGSPLSTFVAAYDPAGNRIQRLRDIGGSLTGDSIQYDSRQRIGLFDEVVSSVKRIVKGYLRDADGNWSTFLAQDVPSPPSVYSFVSAVDDWYYTHIAGRSLEHDVAGNRTSDSWFDYEYDAFDRLVCVRARDTQTVVGRYSYDAFTRRIEKQDWLGNHAQFVYEGQRIAETRDESGAVVDQYVHGQGLDELIEWSHVDHGPLYALTDDMGSVVGLTDATGDVVERVSYDAFGAPTFRDKAGEPILHDSGLPVAESPLGNRILFQGRDYDAELALWRRSQPDPAYFAEVAPAGQYNFRYRYVSPEEGRFTGRDPLAMASNGTIDPSFLVGRILSGESESPYELASGSPVNRDDPFGLSTLMVQGINRHGELTRVLLDVVEDISDDDLAGWFWIAVDHMGTGWQENSISWQMGCGPGGMGGEGFAGGGRSGGGGSTGKPSGGGSGGGKPPRGGSSGSGSTPPRPRGSIGGRVVRGAGKLAGAAAPVVSVWEARQTGKVTTAAGYYFAICINPPGAATNVLVGFLEDRIRDDPGLPTPMPPRTGSTSLRLLLKYRMVKEAYDNSRNPDTGKGDRNLGRAVNNIRVQAREMSCTVFSHLTNTNGVAGPINNMDVAACMKAHEAAVDTAGTGTEVACAPPEQGGGDGEVGHLEREGPSPAAVAALARFRSVERSTAQPDREDPPPTDSWIALFPLALIRLFGARLFAQ